MNEERDMQAIADEFLPYAYEPGTLFAMMMESLNSDWVLMVGVYEDLDDALEDARRLRGSWVETVAREDVEGLDRQEHWPNLLAKMKHWRKQWRPLLQTAKEKGDEG
jgi:hypothetical protein